MSLFSKFVGGSFLPLAYSQIHNAKRTKINECHVDAHAEQDAEALQKIFEEGAQAGTMDPHEMMEMMMEKRNSLKPFPFEKLMQNTAMFK